MHGQMPKLTHMRPFLQGLGLFEGRPVLSSMLNPILPGVCGGVCRMNTPCNPSIYLSISLSGSVQAWYP